VLALYRRRSATVVGWVLVLPDGSACIIQDGAVIQARDLETVAGRWATLTDSVLVWVATKDAT
jgi:hypothetical protein